MKYLSLGASIYVPATRKDLISIACDNKLPARSIIFCTEDSVREDELPLAYTNLEKMLKANHKSEKTLKFIRPRNVQNFKKVLSLSDIDSIDGFVFPKITKESFLEYMHVLQEQAPQKHFWLMPTLETKEVFSVTKMEELRTLFLEKGYYNQILSLRIGGNDLLNLLGIRRSHYRTIYETPLGLTIANLVTIFKPYGFNLTAPVCEFLHDNEILNKELPIDLEYGLFGKTAIHPDQIQIIEHAYRPTEHEVEMAEAMLAKDAPAVFGMHNTMCELATHGNWAQAILKRAEIYGVFGKK